MMTMALVLTLMMALVSTLIRLLYGVDVDDNDGSVDVDDGDVSGVDTDDYVDVVLTMITGIQS